MRRGGGIFLASSIWPRRQCLAHVRDRSGPDAEPCCPPDQGNVVVRSVQLPYQDSCYHQAGARHVCYQHRKNGLPFPESNAEVLPRQDPSDMRGFRCWTSSCPSTGPVQSHLSKRPRGSHTRADFRVDAAPLVMHFKDLMGRLPDASSGEHDVVVTAVKSQNLAYSRLGPQSSVSSVERVHVKMWFFNLKVGDQKYRSD